MVIYSIYLATNIADGNKSYVGFTSKTLKHRQYQHKYHSTHGSKFYFHRALNLYGWENFHWKIIYQSLQLEHTINVMEKYFINEYNTYTNGYNLTLGGEGSTACKTYSWTPERREKRSVISKKLKHSVETKKLKKVQCSKKWEVVSPEGEKYIIFNLKEFCLTNNLHYSCMLNVSKGRLKYYKFWKCSQINNNDQILQDARF
jgi:group I intron endonuclease